MPARSGHARPSRRLARVGRGRARRVRGALEHADPSVAQRLEERHDFRTGWIDRALGPGERREFVVELDVQTERFHGRVVARETESPIAGAVVRARAGESRAELTTDAEGRFVLPLVRSATLFTIEAQGFAEVEFAVGDGHGTPEKALLIQLERGCTPGRRARRREGAGEPAATRGGGRLQRLARRRSRRDTHLHLFARNPTLARPVRRHGSRGHHWPARGSATSARRARAVESGARAARRDRSFGRGKARGQLDPSSGCEITGCARRSRSARRAPRTHASAWQSSARDSRDRGAGRVHGIRVRADGRGRPIPIPRSRSRLVAHPAGGSRWLARGPADAGRCRCRGDEGRGSRGNAHARGSASRSPRNLDLRPPARHLRLAGAGLGDRRWSSRRSVDEIRRERPIRARPARPGNLSPASGLPREWRQVGGRPSRSRRA
ncbi:MAG: carboxypeptidase regulatory-like domain-containing protein [Planctomycetes bacterium]|nr:carboxypeptidase regulatory-like domain-containing protein [Planctomycetota bacterium]